MNRPVRVESGSVHYAQNISIGPHLLHADEPADVGGNDAGPNAYELLLAALGACVSITLQMYAARKQWSLHAVRVEVAHEKALAGADRDGEARIQIVDRISVRLSLGGDLSEDQFDRLVQIAERCPIHRILVPQVQIQTTCNDSAALWHQSG
jgi:putative redox protein